MPKYAATIYETRSYTITVEAEDKHEARAKALATFALTASIEPCSVSNRL
jgi:hypothetical protein